jgi:cytochrome c oxidase subunit I+III
VLTAMQAVRVQVGYVSLKLPYEPMVVRPLWMYTLGVFWIAYASFILLPMAWGGA